jgi:C-methyltransferase C-terminal domain/Putative zinc binding domain/Methyltransferase domain
MAELISRRGSSECRVCGSDNLVNVLDLGAQPLPAEYGYSQDEVKDAFPLYLRICPRCGLGQLGEYVLPERIFHAKYPYLSSASSTWVKHAKQYASVMAEKLSLDASSLVVELASNDGYLLSEFRQLGVAVLGVEPAANVAEIAQATGVPTISKFFGVKLAKVLVSEHGHPRLIVANNVFAHVPDMHDFTEGMAILADDETVITIENPSFSVLLQQALFDTIYHEHYSYLSAHSVRAVAQSHGLDLFHVDHLPTHGGSNRYWLSRSRRPDETVKATLDAEVKDGLFEPEMWESFSERSRTAISGLREWLTERKQAGDVVAGYGAAHKGNTFLNAVGEASKNLVYVVDASQEKHGKFLPGSQVPVLPPDELNAAKPTDVLILPWNIAPELAQRIEVLAPQARIWVAQPSMRQI